MHQRKSLRFRDVMVGAACILPSALILSGFVWLAIRPNNGSSANPPADYASGLFLGAAILYLAFVLGLVGVSRLLGHDTKLVFSYGVVGGRFVWSDTSQSANSIRHALLVVTAIAASWGGRHIFNSWVLTPRKIPVTVPVDTLFHLFSWL